MVFHGILSGVSFIIMDSRLFLLAFTLIWKSSEGIKCYQCEPRTSTYHAILQPRICENFNTSDYFIDECAASTMCFKKSDTITFPDGRTMTTYQRGCAAQTLNGDQEKINGKWTHVTKIYDVYAETCKEESSSEGLLNTVQCYCRGELCNRAHRTHRHYSILVLITVSIFAWAV